MSSTPLEMGFLSSLVDIHFPSACGLIWVQMGVNAATPIMTLQGGPLKSPFNMIVGKTNAGPLGSPTTLAAYGGRSLLYPNTPPFAQVAANFLAFRIVSGDPVNISARITGGAPFCTLACGLISALDFSTLDMIANSFDTGELSFSNGASNAVGTDAVLEQGGFEYNESGGEVTYFGNIVTAFDQNNSAGVSNSFTFTRTSCSVTQN